MKEQMITPTERLIHPWHQQLEGLREGKGNFYHWGPNYTVDPIVLTNELVPKVLLIQRRDNGKWALPGGFVDENEDTVAAGIRELFEETQLQLGDTDPTIVYTGPVHDHRATLHAWPETTAMVWHVEDCRPITASDDAANAKWVPLNELPEELHGSHKDLIALAVRDTFLAQPDNS